MLIVLMETQTMIVKMISISVCYVIRRAWGRSGSSVTVRWLPSWCTAIMPVAATASSVTFSGRTTRPMPQVSGQLYTRGKEECDWLTLPHGEARVQEELFHYFYLWNAERESGPRLIWAQVQI